ncbi:MAG: response regulator [Myxococcota bacterium]
MSAAGDGAQNVFFAGSPEPKLIVDAESQQVLAANAAMAQLLGRDDLLERASCELVEPSEQSTWRVAVAAAGSGAIQPAVQVWLRRGGAAASRVPVEGRFTSFQGDDGRGRLLVSFRDLSERYEFGLARRLLASQLERSQEAERLAPEARKRAEALLEELLGDLRVLRNELPVGARRRVQHALGVTKSLRSVLGMGPTIADPTLERPAPRGLALVADDDAALRRTLGRMLHRKGFRVELAADGVEAVQLLEQRADELRLVVLDLLMPRVDGLTAYGHVRQLAPELPVILCSGEEGLTTPLPTGPHTRFVVKPFEAAVLEGFVDELTEPASVAAGEGASEPPLASPDL